MYQLLFYVPVPWHLLFRSIQSASTANPVAVAAGLVAAAVFAPLVWRLVKGLGR